MPRKQTKRDTFPLDDNSAAACCRAETILDQYQKARGDNRGDWYALAIRAIADLAILAHAEYAVACGESAAEGDNPPSRGGGIEYVCDEGEALAWSLVEHTRLCGEDEEYAELVARKPAPSIF